ncbi:hypothetical protein MCOR02_003072 [Pyricularia oryzae]|nr:hypothetical protein MCOR02_003072 [Pyricularia oryzae]
MHCGPTGGRVLKKISHTAKNFLSLLLLPLQIPFNPTHSPHQFTDHGDQILMDRATEPCDLMVFSMS